MELNLTRWKGTDQERVAEVQQKSCEQTRFSLFLVNMLEEPGCDRDSDYSYDCCDEPNIIYNIREGGSC
jgi:hypothetical protein